MELYIRVKTQSSPISLHHSSQTSISVFEPELFKYCGLIYITESVKLLILELNVKQRRPSQHQKKVMPILNIALISSLHFTVSLKKISSYKSWKALSFMQNQLRQLKIGHCFHCFFKRHI